jgi:hypothetical protein
MRARESRYAALIRPIAIARSDVALAARSSAMTGARSAARAEAIAAVAALMRVLARQ